MTRATVLVLVLVVAGATGRLPETPPETQGDAFVYVRSLEINLVERVELERQSARVAGDDGDAERWAVTLALLLEISRGASDPPSRAVALDVVLDELVRARARDLIDGLSPGRRRSLQTALAGFKADDPVGLRRYTRQQAQRRLDVISRDVLAADDPNAVLDGLLADHGWRAAGGDGPLGRQRARDRADFRVIDRHDVFSLVGMTRRHMLLPPTEGWGGLPLEELDRKWQRARNLAGHMDRLWVHQDGPRVHDFLLDLALRDATGIVRLVHADTPLLAQADRLRRWRLREAVWRLGGE